MARRGAHFIRVLSFLPLPPLQLLLLPHRVLFGVLLSAPGARAQGDQGESGEGALNEHVISGASN